MDKITRHISLLNILFQNHNLICCKKKKRLNCSYSHGHATQQILELGGWDLFAFGQLSNPAMRYVCWCDLQTKEPGMHR